MRAVVGEAGAGRCSGREVAARWRGQRVTVQQLVLSGRRRPEDVVVRRGGGAMACDVTVTVPEAERRRGGAAVAPGKLMDRN